MSDLDTVDKFTKNILLAEKIQFIKISDGKLTNLLQEYKVYCNNCLEDKMYCSNCVIGGRIKKFNNMLDTTIRIRYVNEHKKCLINPSEDRKTDFRCKL